MSKMNGFQVTYGHNMNTHVAAFGSSHPYHRVMQGLDFGSICQGAMLVHLLSHSPYGCVSKSRIRKRVAGCAGVSWANSAPKFGTGTASFWFHFGPSIFRRLEGKVRRLEGGKPQTWQMQLQQVSCEHPVSGREAIRLGAVHQKFKTEIKNPPTNMESDRGPGRPVSF